MTRLRAAVVGATGAVGQKFVRLLDQHPWFALTTVIASERSEGKRYADAVRWLEPSLLPDAAAEMTVRSIADDFEADIVFSALDAALAREHEPRLAARFAVVSNASAFRQDATVPLLVPEVNGDHAGLIARQRFGKGFIVTVPNCSTVGLVGVLKPLDEAIGVEAVHVTTLQAISGAGYPGVPSLDIVGNVIPFIGGEEEKIEREPLKILGRLTEGGVAPAPLRVSAHVHRVPVVDGHMLAMSIGLRRRVEPAEVAAVLTAFESPQTRGLPSAPSSFLHVFERDDFPQPRLHAALGGGMTISVGRVRPCALLGVRLEALVHNTVRGAAGNAILIAELLTRDGYVGGRPGAWDLGPGPGHSPPLTPSP